MCKVVQRRLCLLDTGEALGPALIEPKIFNAREVIGIFFGLVGGCAFTLARLKLTRNSDIGWAVGSALAGVVVFGFFQNIGMPVPLLTRDHLFGFFCGTTAGALAVSFRWPVKWLDEQSSASTSQHDSRST